MTGEKHKIMYASADGEVIGLDEVQLLDPIVERIAPLRALLAGPNAYDAYQAALILAAWGDARGARSVYICTAPSAETPRLGTMATTAVSVYSEASPSLANCNPCCAATTRRLC
jgi:hypothetical protein